MSFGVSPVTAIVWLVVTLFVQSAVDVFFTRGKLPPMADRDRFWSWLAVSAGVVFLLVLVFRLTLFSQEVMLLWMRDRGIMALGTLLLVVEYFVWAVPFVLARGALMQRWRGEGMIDEKRRAYWGYVWVGSIVSVFLIGFLYVAVAIVSPLMIGVEERFGG